MEAKNFKELNMMAKDDQEVTFGHQCLDFYADINEDDEVEFDEYVKSHNLTVNDQRNYVTGSKNDVINFIKKWYPEAIYEDYFYYNIHLGDAKQYESEND